MEDYKLLTSLLDFLQANAGESGVVIEADTVQLISTELQQLLRLHEVQQGEQ